MRKKTVASLGAFGIILGAVAIPNAQAYQGDPTVQGPNYSPSRHEAIEKALQANDYNTWKKLMEDRGYVTQVVNEKNFPEYAKARMLLKEGKKTEAIAILKSIGLAQNNGSGIGNGAGRLGQKQRGAPQNPMRKLPAK